MANDGSEAIPQRIVKIDDYQPHPKNYNFHPEEQIIEIAASLEKFGQVKGVVVWKGFIVAGHGVVQAAKKLGWSSIKAEVLPDTWSEFKALAYLAADNELSRGADPDLDALALLAAEIKDYDPVLARLASGSDERLQELMDHLSNSDSELEEVEDESTPELSDGSLLELIEVTIAEPRHKVESGDYYFVGPHVLVVVDVLTGWPDYVRFLTVPGEVIFAPYPGPFVPMTLKAEGVNRVVMVQPDRYIAGHILDRWADVHGENTVLKG